MHGNPNARVVDQVFYGREFFLEQAFPVKGHVGMRGQRDDIGTDAHQPDAFIPAITQHDAERVQVVSADPEQVLLVRPGQGERRLVRSRHANGFTCESVSDHSGEDSRKAR